MLHCENSLKIEIATGCITKPGMKTPSAVSRQASPLKNQDNYFRAS
jgi:hypothetical protein